MKSTWKFGEGWNDEKRTSNWEIAEVGGKGGEVEEVGEKILCLVFLWRKNAKIFAFFLFLCFNIYKTYM
jgi:hypothetical protein